MLQKPKVTIIDVQIKELNGWFVARNADTPKIWFSSPYIKDIFTDVPLLIQKWFADHRDLHVQVFLATYFVEKIGIEQDVTNWSSISWAVVLGDV